MQTTYVKIYKSGNGQAISLKKNTLQEAGLKVGDDISKSQIRTNCFN
ncbi:hypothetical protein [Staphylococcus warneri]